MKTPTHTLTMAAAGMVAALMLSTGTAHAECTTDIAKDDLTDAQVQGLYDCIKDKLRSGYLSKDEAEPKAYVIYKAASTLPAVNGSHGNRFLMTYVNDIAFPEYTKFSEERGAMPAGSILAKESFNVSKKGKLRNGPLFFMTKVAAGTADEFGNWIYSAYSPKGKVMKIKQGFCHACHEAFSDQDSMGYPGEDYRVSASQ
ncbi:MAG: cytochrome P460 family protein [Pseudomonadota bacterium]